MVKWLLILLVTANSAMTSASAVLASLDANDEGADDELASALKLASERITAYLMRQLG